MRFAMVLNTYPPRLGGVEMHAFNLADQLTQLGHKVWVLTLDSERSIRQDGKVQVLTGIGYLPIAEVISYPALGSAAAISRFLKAKRIDVVSTHTRFFPMSFVGARAAQKAGIPYIHTEHGSNFVNNSNPIIAIGSRVVDLSLGRYVITHAAQVLGVSEAAANFAGYLGAKDPQVFYNAINLPETPYTGPQRPNHLVFIGRMVEGKG